MPRRRREDAALHTGNPHGVEQNLLDEILLPNASRCGEERPIFFGHPGQEQYGVIHYPSGEGRDIGIVMCPPLFTENMEAHGIFVVLARLLAENGYPVIRFDYRGTGESEGEWSDYSIPEYLSDILRASEQLRTRTGVAKIGLLGLRMGATLALISATRCDPTAFVVALEPVVNGREYVRELLRLNIAEQMRYRLEVKAGLRKLVETIRSGESVLIVSFPLDRKKYDDLEEIDLRTIAGNISIPTAVFSLRSARNGDDSVRELYQAMEPAPKGSLFRTIECPPFWKQTPRMVRRAPELFEAVREWLDAIMMLPAGAEYGDIPAMTPEELASVPEIRAEIWPG